MMDNFFEILDDRDEYYEFLEGLLVKREALCSHMSKELPLDKEYKMFGYCNVCDTPATFLLDWNYSDKKRVNFRERLCCDSCGLNNRQRFVRAFLDQIVKKNGVKSVYLYEQVTHFFSHYQSHAPEGVAVVGSEYLGFDKEGGDVINGIRHEDALNLSFEDKSFDVIVSQDVLEHVPDLDLAIEEAKRVLSDKGVMLFTVPFDIKKNLTVKRAELGEKERVNHIHPEMYHGNPVDENGSLVFYDFGWDIFDIFRKYDFKLKIISYWSHLYGHINPNPFCFVASKKDSEII